jgi:hypothetical protein
MPWHRRAVAETHFDERVAARYETYWPELFEPAVVDPAVNFLAELAGDGGALELGVGTGRIALPLGRRGVRVHGIELSPAMVARLREQPGAEAVGTTIGDFATTRVSGRFRLAYLVRNTITNLTTQDEQVECFRTVAAHLGLGEEHLAARGHDRTREPAARARRPALVTTTALAETITRIASQPLTGRCWPRATSPG